MLPDPLFELFGKGVYMYGLMIAVGILLCLVVFFVCTKKKGMPEKVRDFIFCVAIVAIAVGFLIAKLYQAVYNYIETGYFDFYSAGITVMGGLIGGAGAFLLVYFLAGKFMFKGKEKGLHVKEFNKVFLIAPSCITIAHAFGRIGCMCAGCCYGKETAPGSFLVSIYNHGAYRIPVQLYEALFLFALFGLLTFLYFRRCNFTMAIYLIAYGAWRIFIEFYRADHRGELGGSLSPSQWQSILFIAGGVVLIVIYLILRIPLIFPKGDTSMLLAPISKFEIHDSGKEDEANIKPSRKKKQEDISSEDSVALEDVNKKE